MLVLVSPPNGLAGFFQGKSLVGGKDFIFIDPESSFYKPRLFAGKLVMFGDYTFPDTADSDAFMERLRENALGYDAEKDGEYSEFFQNRLTFTIESYLAELNPPVEASKPTTRKPTAKKEAE